MLEDIIKERRKKLEALNKEGINPYPAETKRTILAEKALADFDNFEKEEKKFFLAGRIRGLRDQGKIAFIDIEDKSGRIQAVVKSDQFADFDKIVPNLDIGDFVEISGSLFKTNKGHKSIKVESLKVLVKSLRPLPDDYYGLEDEEIKLRKRYLDILLDPKVKDIFIKKSIFWKAIRKFLDKEKFLEVETPVLEAIPGGAEAEPFITHHNALNEDFYLRISLEIALKKILVSGYEKIYEIGRIFRNEGIDSEHLQDYTQLEFYWAYADYNDLMKMVEKMYKSVIKETFGTLEFERNGEKINWKDKWKKVDYFEIFKEYSGLDLKKCSEKDLIEKAKELKIEDSENLGKGRLIDLIFKKTARAKLIKPCFLINPPIEIEPLAKRYRKDKNRVERFQVVAYGIELGKGFSEANDPIDQRERFEEQEKLRGRGDKEAQRLDEDFLEALEYGMPPAAGFGFSERLFSVLAGRPIRECVFFPAMRRKK